MPALVEKQSTYISSLNIMMPRVCGGSIGSCVIPHCSSGFASNNLTYRFPEYERVLLELVAM
jgi:hypothetical protein